MGLIAGGGDALENLNEIRRAMRGLLGSTDPEKVAEYEGLKLLYGIDNPESGAWSPKDWQAWEAKLKYIPDDLFDAPGLHSPTLEPYRYEEAGPQPMTNAVEQIWDAYEGGGYPAMGTADPKKVEALYGLYENSHRDVDPKLLRDRFFNDLTRRRADYEIELMTGDFDSRPEDFLESLLRRQTRTGARMTPSRDTFERSAQAITDEDIIF